MNIVKSEFIHAGVVIPLNTFDEQNRAVNWKNDTSKILQSVYAEHYFGLKNEIVSS